jgi:hypothetical protein
VRLNNNHSSGDCPIVVFNFVVRLIGPKFHGQTDVFGDPLFRDKQIEGIDGYMAKPLLSIAWNYFIIDRIIHSVVIHLIDQTHCIEFTWFKTLNQTLDWTHLIKHWIGQILKWKLQTLDCHVIRNWLRFEWDLIDHIFFIWIDYLIVYQRLFCFFRILCQQRTNWIAWLYAQFPIDLEIVWIWCWWRLDLIKAQGQWTDVYSRSCGILSLITMQ